jgi:hypothetical protein
MRLPRRIRRQKGRHALVDGIPFKLPIDSERTPALMAAFPIAADRAAELLPGPEIRPVKLPGGRGLLLITVVDYKITDIGSYIEFSIAIACRRGLRPGQFVLDLPVSSEVSVKGGKGIWGMPKHQAYLDFDADERTARSRYFLDGEPAVTIEVDRPRFERIPLAASAANYCQFRGMLMKSQIYFRGRGGVNAPFRSSARLTIGDQPRVAPLKPLDVGERPLFSGYFPETRGVLDDHVEGWFLAYDEPPQATPEGLESVIDLGQGQEWLPAPGKPSPTSVK